MARSDSVTVWLDGLRAGDTDPIRRLWDRYFERLVRLAGARLPRHTRRVLDEEDVALSAFHSFCDRVGRGQFPDLADRDDLWRLLATITTRKAVNTMRHQTRAKRGGGCVLGESALTDGDASTAEGLEQFLGREPDPEVVAQFTEEYERLLARLDDPTLKTVALRKLDGYTCEEIAAELGVSSRTVDRKLRLIRALWEEDVTG